MSDFVSDPLLRELRQRFRTTVLKRVEDMRTLAAALAADPQDVISARALLRHFHFVAGMGATSGYPAASAVGDAAESSLAGHLERQSVSPEAVEECREFIARIESAVGE